VATVPGMPVVTGTSETPNPDALRFTLDVPVEGMRNITSAEAAADDPFAAAVFGTDGVVAVFATADFVTVTRAPGTDWAPIVAAVEAAASLL
jgi:hypothetical protein